MEVMEPLLGYFADAVSEEEVWRSESERESRRDAVIDILEGGGGDDEW
jgi:hypothetical protein